MSNITRFTSIAAAALLAVGLVTAAGASASAVSVSPPGANDFGCVPTAAHPYPVVLVPGTFETMVKNWSTLSPYLKQQGYCVYALDYGTTNGIAATAAITTSAAELSVFVDRVLAASGARQVDLVGHSQGGMMPRYYLGFLDGARKVHQLVGIAPSNHGTTGIGSPFAVPTPVAAPRVTGSSFAVPNPTVPVSSPRALTAAPLPAVCPACDDQAAGSPFLTQLNSIGDIVDGPSYTVIATVNDEIVRPYTSQALAGSSDRVTNIVIQDLCPLDPIEHDQAPNDPVVHQLVGNALAQKSGPADPAFRPSCL